MPADEAVKHQWQALWPAALELWSKFTRLSEPRWCLSAKDAKAEGLTDSFAMIRLTDQAIVVNLEEIVTKQLAPFALEILGHEIGHHVFAPADLTDQGRIIGRIRRSLPGYETLAGLIANLYTDLLINDRLQRVAGLRMDQVFRKLVNEPGDKLWTLYMRIYEILWRLESGALTRCEQVPDSLTGDALLGARLIRSYARDWVNGAGSFAALCLPYVMEDGAKRMRELLRGWLDTQHIGAGDDAQPAGLTELDQDEAQGGVHPALDPRLAGSNLPDEQQENADKPPESVGQGTPGRQYRQPYEYGEILNALGMKLDDHEVAVRYYRERAVPYLVRFPTRVMPETSEPLPEGLASWDPGSPVEDIDWLGTVITSPKIVPGFTTMQRVWGTTEGSLPSRQPVDLDIYVDCSGSMPNPQQLISYLALAGAILIISALRAGARVQATLWSGGHQYDTSHGFIRDETQLLRILTGYLGNGTAFPIHLLRDTYAGRKPEDRPVHIVVISDDGFSTMYDKDEKGNSGKDIADMALKNCRGGGSLVLNMFRSGYYAPLLTLAEAQGWRVHLIQSWDELLTFAHEFSRAAYGDAAGAPPDEGVNPYGGN